MTDRRQMLSVVVATRDRARFLARCLDSLAAAGLAGDRHELVVVDNGSTDATPRILDRETRSGRFRLRVVREPLPGLARARNAGVTNAAGDFLVFLDDDGRVARRWLAAFERLLLRARQPIVQGRILPRFAAPPPKWLTRAMWPRLGQVDQGGLSGPLQSKMHGGNLGVARRVFDAVGLFREDLGLGASGLGEDTEFAGRARGAGFSPTYAPDALMLHCIPRDRVTRVAFLRRYFRSGISQATFQDYPESPARTLASWLRQSVRRVLGAAFAPDPATAMALLCDLAEHTGRVAQLARTRLTRAGRPDA